MMQDSDLELLLINKLRPLRLSKQEYKVALGILDGLNNQQIADKLSIRIKAVKCRNTAIYKKAKVTNRSHFCCEIYKQIVPKGLPESRPLEML
jgi:DNA-binding NarL/FixJ family response regulator